MLGKKQSTFPRWCCRDLCMCVCDAVPKSRRQAKSSQSEVLYTKTRPLDRLAPPTVSLHAGDLIAQTRAEEQELAAGRLARCSACCHFLRCLPVLLILAYIVYTLLIHLRPECCTERGYWGISRIWTEVELVWLNYVIPGNVIHQQAK